MRCCVWTKGDGRILGGFIGVKAVVDRLSGAALVVARR